MNLPLLYRRPIPVEPASCGGLGVRGDGTARFAAAASAVPLGIDEFFAAQAVFPIVFSIAATPLPMALLGLVTGINLFVDAAGIWRPRAYMPAYMRRYPFILASQAEADRLALYIDRDCDLVVEAGGEALFANGAPTPYTERMLAFAHGVHQQLEHAASFAAALAQHDLLVERTAEVAMPGGARHLVQGFRIVDETRFNALPDAVWLDWRRRGWIGLLHAHLLSQGRWASLVEIAGERQDALA
jgi:hypothetical protein